MTICQAAQQADLATQFILSREQEQTLEQETAREALPHWVGRLEVRASREDEAGNVVSQKVPTAAAQFFGVYAKLEDGTEQHLRDFDTRGEARDYARGLETERWADERIASMAPPVTELTYINVPYEERAEAKELGAEYDGNAKSWYVPSDIDAESLTGKWPVHDPAVTRAAQEEARAERAAVQAEGRMYINVPRAEKEEAKEMGARWDRAAVSGVRPRGRQPRSPHFPLAAT